MLISRTSKDLDCALYPVGMPGLPDTVIHAGRVWCRPSVAPDGRSVVVLQGDFERLLRVSLLDGLATPFHSLRGISGGEIVGFKRLANGAIEIVERESEQTLGWYALAAPGAEFRRLGSTAVRGTGDYDISDDGRHVVANVSEPRPDVDLISNFGDFLRH